ncbi:hypothetical protein HanRHA438_Chr06g0266591 [Helianthus annuus]|nr:hypothetical protein HanRHA438_Chr06g0266591 [Helianthus annuus]
MPPAIRRGRGGRGRGTIITHNDHEAGPSNMRAPSSTRSEEPQRRRRNLFEHARHSTSHSSTPSYRHSFGPDSENNPNNPQLSFIPLQQSASHRSYGDPSPFFIGHINQADYVQEPIGYNPLGPEDHFSEDNAMDMDEDTDPVEPARGTPNHPIEISDGSSFHVTPYQGPDSYQARFGQCNWYFTPLHQYSPHDQQQQQDPSEDSRFVAVTPPPPPPVQPVIPDPPRRRRSGTRMSTRGGEFHFSTPRHSSASHFPSVPEEEPQFGEPSGHPAEVNSAPVAPPPPPFGYDNPIPAYGASTAYNPFEQPTHTHYNYNYDADPYVLVANYNALHGTSWRPDYSAHGYPIPPRPPVQQPSQQPRFSPPEQEEILHRLNRVERDFEQERKSNRGFLKGLANLLKGRKKRDH